MAPETEYSVHTYHFDLGFLRRAYDKPYVQTPRGRFPLLPHTAETRERARAENRAVASMAEADLAKLTHYVDGVENPLKAPFMLRVHNDDGGTESLPTLFGVKIQVPIKAAIAYWITDLERLSRRNPAHYDHFGLVPPDATAEVQDRLAFMADAEMLVDLPTATAGAIAFSHPQLCSTSVKHAAMISHLFIGRSKHLSPFASYIRSMGEAGPDGTGFAVITPLTDDNGSSLTLNPALVAAGGQDRTLCLYSLGPDLIGVPPTATTPAEPPKTQTPAALLNDALIAMTNEPGMRDSHWSVNQGRRKARYQSGVTDKGVVDRERASLRRMTPSRRAMAAASTTDGGTSGYDFTVNNKTPGHGLDVQADSITFDSTDNVFGIEVMNTYLRTLAAHVIFYDMDGAVVPNPPSLYPELQSLIAGLKESLGLEGDEEFLQFIFAVYTIMDIPVQHGTTTVSMKWPDGAASADILFGGLGHGPWDATTDILGIVATVLFQFVSPVIFLVTGAWVTHSDWYKKLMANKAVAAMVVVIAFIIITLVAAVTGLLRYELNFILNLITNKVVGFALGTLAKELSRDLLRIINEGSEVLCEFFLFKITVDDVIDAIPFVGWVTEVAGIAATAGGLIEASVDVAMSPATYTVQVTRRLVVTATVSPDPLHGTAEDPAIWPDSATHYKAVLQYKDGTAYTVTGALPLEQADRATPVEVVFDDVPTGGQFQITFGVYSNSDWLAGNWTGAWTQAVLPAGADTLAITGAIIESLVPLTASTQYLYDSKIVYTEDKGHQWHAGDQPTAVQGDLNADGLNAVVAITANNNAYMLGYTWQAANQNVPVQGTTGATDAQLYTFQNISMLSDPEAALKFSGAGFAARTFLAYEQFGPEALFYAPLSAQSDLDNGVIDDALVAAFAAGGYPLPDDLSTVTVATVSETVEWTITLPDQGGPTYQLNRQSDSIAVMMYPANMVGQNNVYLDSSKTVLQLRAVVLDDDTPFDMDQTVSHGAFMMRTIDALVIHPANYAVGVSYDNHTMEIVPILQTAVSDAEATAGTLAGGKGVRQGLMRGPKAVAITRDGRILVLEAINRRIQAFDINGNPVPSFDGASVTTLAATDYAPDLDKGLVSLPLRDAFAAAGFALSQHWQIRSGTDRVDVALADNGLLRLSLNGAPLSAAWTITDVDGTTYAAQLGPDAITVTQPDGGTFPLDVRAEEDLDLGFLGAFGLAGFAKAGVAVSQRATVAGDGLYVDPADCESDLTQNIVPPAITEALATVYLTLGSDQTVVSVVENDVQAEGTVWLITDPDADVTYQISVDADDTGQLDAVELSPFLYLRVNGAQTPITEKDVIEGLLDGGTTSDDTDEKYLDMATEMKGYIYVLGYTGTGSDPSDYFLDLYDPQGAWLSRTPDTERAAGATGVNGGRIAIDMWRNLYTLNFEAISGPGGRVEPSVGLWVPTTPDGTA
jgi:hypothetical protein